MKTESKYINCLKIKDKEENKNSNYKVKSNEKKPLHFKLYSTIA